LSRSIRALSALTLPVELFLVSFFILLSPFFFFFFFFVVCCFIY